MTVFFIVLFAVAATGLIWQAGTRSAKLRSVAKMLNIRFDRTRDTITTDSTAGHLEFFARFFRLYFNVCTFSDALAFMRLADVHVFLDENPKSKPLVMTVFTAEMKRTQFPGLKIVPHKSPFAACNYTFASKVSALEKTYRIYGSCQQTGLLLTPAIVTFLKNHPDTYIEANDNAFIYHEHRLITVEDFQTFRLRALQILHEMERAIQTAQQTAAAETKPDTPQNKPEDKKDSFDQAEAMLAALSAGHNSPTEPSSNKWMGASIVILLVGAVVLSIVAWALVHRLQP
jgi:hypothetical protein